MIIWLLFGEVITALLLSTALGFGLVITALLLSAPSDFGPGVAAVPLPMASGFGARITALHARSAPACDGEYVPWQLSRVVCETLPPAQQ